jgi:hypothetical protein
VDRIGIVDHKLDRGMRKERGRSIAISAGRLTRRLASSDIGAGA